MLNLREVDLAGTPVNALSAFSMPAFRVPPSITGTLGGELGYEDAADFMPDDVFLRSDEPSAVTSIRGTADNVAGPAGV